MIERHVQTIFCDDIRHELGGKLSYIGVYSGVLYVPTFPAILPKLCLSVQIVSPAEKPLQSLELRILKDDEPLQEIVVDKEQLAAASQPPENMPDEELTDQVQLAKFLVVFSPLQLEEPCVLRVRVQTEDGELRGLALKVDQVPPTQ